MNRIDHFFSIIEHAEWFVDAAENFTNDKAVFRKSGDTNFVQSKLGAVIADDILQISAPLEQMPPM